MEHLSHLDRRQFLKYAGTASVYAAMGHHFMGAVSVPPTSVPPLKDLAAKKGIVFGSATNANHLQSDKEYAALIAEQCAIITPSNELKMKYLQPSPNSFKFDEGDWIVNWALSRKIKVHGTSLVYGLPAAMPSWADSYVNRSNARNIMVKHVSTVAQHYAGKVRSWDVVNEALQGDDLRETIWLRLIGPEYLEIAYKTAAEADPNAMLVYNENNLEWANQDGKRNGTLKLLKNLLSKKAPVHALGMQSHLRYEMGGFAPAKLRQFMDRVSDLGLTIRISELDSRERDTDVEVKDRDRGVAEYYATFMAAVLENKSVIDVETWNLTDRYTWLSKEAPRHDGQAVRPLPFDEHLRPKPAYDALARAFQQAPPR